MTLAEDFREARDWLVQHKRDPFLWLVILGPLVFASITFWGVFVFPLSDAEKAIRQVLPGVDVSLGPKNFPKCQGQAYIFGYEFGPVHGIVHNSRPYGYVCRDVVNGGWVVDNQAKN